MFPTTRMEQLFQELKAKDSPESLDCETLYIHDHVYNAMTLFAKGHKYVPIRIAPALDSAVIYVLRDVDMIGYLRGKGDEILNDVRYTQILFDLLKSRLYFVIKLNSFMFTSTSMT